MSPRSNLLLAVLAAVAILGATTVAPAAIFYPISSVSTNAIPAVPTPISIANLIQGPGVGFDAVVPHNATGSTWYSHNPNGGGNYFPNPATFTLDLGTDVPLHEISTWGYASTNANGVRDFNVQFATEAEGPGAAGTSITFNPSYTMLQNPTPRQSFAFGQTVTARYVLLNAVNNYGGQPGAGAGGDRVGLHEIAFEAPLPPPPTGTGIINPILVGAADLNTFGSFTPDHVTDNSGLSAAVNEGDSLAHALSVTHQIDGGAAHNWVTNDNTADYFSTGPAPPTFVWDLRTDINLDQVVLWQYGSAGGGDTDGAGTRSGNSARTVELRFNTEAEGSVTFTGAATTVVMSPVLDSDPTGGMTIVAGPEAQGFSLSATARYVEMRLEDNHATDPDGLGVHPTIGGDRVGLGEVRFHGTVVPEPSSLALLALGAVVCGLFRRRRSA